MRVLISGATGLVGKALCNELTGNGHEVLRLVRAPTPEVDALTWDPGAGTPIQDERLAGLDAVVHLAGENIAGRWTREKKAKILDSRVTGTRLLVESLAALERPPSTLLCASAVGYYGDTGDEVLDESGPRGQGFLADVCEAWEHEARKAEAGGMRTVCLRLGVVLAREGGALAQMLPPFKRGLGGPVGNGRQLMSWITLGDAARAIQHLMAHAERSGPVNLTAPAPVSNQAFTEALGEVLGKPARMPLPAAAVKVLFGEMGKALLLTSTGARPGVLLDDGFTFTTPGLDEALRQVLGKTG
jgi:uncharacterized protein (TIGR01777 family)